MAHLSRILPLVLSVLLVACGDDETVPAGEGGSAGAPPGVCVPGERTLPDGSCVAAGLQDNGCAAGAVFEEGSGCRPAGIPPEQCAPGFEPDDAGGCEPVLPVDPCPAGQMAVPGDEACRVVAPCGEAPWGDLPVEPSTQYVDGSYGGGDSDGSALQPWTLVQDGVDAAEAGAIVAVAAGTYPEDVRIDGQIRLWGRCPELVEISGLTEGRAAIEVAANGADSEIHDLAVTGAGIGVAVLSATGVVAERVWIHDTQAPGLMMFNSSPVMAEGTIRDSLIEDTLVAGVYAMANTVTVERCEVRRVEPWTPSSVDGFGVGLIVDGQPASGSINGSYIHDTIMHGVYATGSDAVVDGSVIRDVAPLPVDGGAGSGVGFGRQEGRAASMQLLHSVIERCDEAGLVGGGGVGLIEHSVLRDAALTAVDPDQGAGASVVLGVGQEPTELTVRSSLVAGNRRGGVMSFGTTVIIEGSIIRDQIPSPSGDFGRGISSQAHEETGTQPALTVRSSVVERNHDVGVFARGAVTIDGSVFSDTIAIDLAHIGSGYGIAVVGDAAPTLLNVSSSVLERNQFVALAVGGCEAVVEGTRISDTAPSAWFHDGQGIHVQHNEQWPALLTLRSSVVERSVTVGVLAAASGLVIDHSVVRDTAPIPEFDTYGDGVGVFSFAGIGATLELSGSRVADNARAGVAGFGASVVMSSSTIECNIFDLNAESFSGFEPTFLDGGGNSCGCEGSAPQCQVVSSGIGPPDPIIE